MMSFWMVPVSLVARRTLLVGDRDVERQQPRRRRVDRHRGVHLIERDARQAARACRRCGRRARRPCRPRPWRARGHCHSRSGSADRRRWTGPSAPSPGCGDRARWTWSPSSGRHRCGRSRACRVPALGAAGPLLSSRMGRPRLRSGVLALAYPAVIAMQNDLCHSGRRRSTSRSSSVALELMALDAHAGEHRHEPGDDQQRPAGRG